MVSHRRVKRHNAVGYFVEQGSDRVPGTMVVREPHLIWDNHRTDLRVSGPGAPRRVLTEFDLTFISTTSKVAQATAHRTERQLLPTVMDRWAIARAALNAILDNKAESKRALYEQLLEHRGTAFTPLEFSLEGASHHAATTALRHWRGLMHSFSYMFNAISITLLRSRAETFALRLY